MTITFSPEFDSDMRDVRSCNTFHSPVTTSDAISRFKHDHKCVGRESSSTAGGDASSERGETLAPLPGKPPGTLPGTDGWMIISVASDASFLDTADAAVGG